MLELYYLGLIFLLAVGMAQLMICWGKTHTYASNKYLPHSVQVLNIPCGKRVSVEVLLDAVYYHLLFVLLPSVFIQRCGEILLHGHRCCLCFVLGKGFTYKVS